ncbi:hypothetical protein UMNK88_5029 [Escherichia coli UMNK88]|nr:hypothetical protein UMNK88_5029 [Escherichia coli UMNK88]
MPDIPVQNWFCAGVSADKPRDSRQCASVCCFIYMSLSDLIPFFASPDVGANV